MEPEHSQNFAEHAVKQLRQYRAAEISGGRVCLELQAVMV